MKRILSLLLLSSVMYAQDTNPSTALESLVLKAGITSLIHDFEREKNITKQHSVDIEELKQNVKFLMEQSLKNKFNVDSDVQTVPISTNSDEIEKLKQENLKLKAVIEQLQSKKVVVNKPIATLTKQAKVTHEKASLKSAPFQSAIRTRYVYFSDILEIEECNKYGWCKLQDKKEYIPKYKIRFIK
jgi:hypothetical protein